MALTRKALKAMGLTEEQVESVVEMHTEVTDKLKEQLNEAKEKADKYDSAKQELDDIKAKGDYKQKYEDEHKAFEDYKKDQADKAEYEKKASAFKEMCKEVGISAKRIDAVARVSADHIKGIKFDKDGKPENADDIKAKIKEENADFIQTSQTVGTNTTNPPASTGGNKKSKEEIYAIKDPVERQKAIAENHELFGF